MSSLIRSQSLGHSKIKDLGSMAIEFVAVLPLLTVVTMICTQAFAVTAAVTSTTRAARDAARAAAAGEDGVAAAYRALPEWVRVNEVELRDGGACLGICADVRVGVPLGIPGVTSVTLVTVNRSADFPVTDGRRR
ncbi:MAG: TadE/TadG family type IV pilus assembly protein [Actinomycetota bacterium]